MTTPPIIIKLNNKIICSSVSTLLDLAYRQTVNPGTLLFISSNPIEMICESVTLNVGQEVFIMSNNN